MCDEKLKCTFQYFTTQKNVTKMRVGEEFVKKFTQTNQSYI